MVESIPEICILVPMRHEARIVVGPVGGYTYGLPVEVGARDRIVQHSVIGMPGVVGVLARR